MTTSIWAEKYRPKTISEVIFQDERQRSVFEAYVNSGDIPNLFLTGVPGTGKTTISLALARELNIDRADILKINCSDSQIDAIRNRVSVFADTMPLGKFKVVRLEEIDYLSPDAQALLRTVIDSAANSCRFIATCNYANRVIHSLKSRLQEFYFHAPDKEKIAIRILDILAKEGVSFDDNDLLAFIDAGYPDIRKTINLIQSNTVNRRLIKPSGKTEKDVEWKFGLLDAINVGDFKRARKLVCESATREEHEDVYRFLYENVSKLKIADEDAAIVIIAEYLKSHALVSDTEINLAACMISLSKLR